MGAKSAALTRVNLTASDLSDGFGHTLDRSNLTFFREYFINFAGVVEGEPGNRPVPANSPTNDPNLADPLIPFVDPYTTTTDGFSQTVGPLWQFMTIVVEQRVYLPMARKS